MISTGPEWKEMVKTPWELVAAVGVDSLEQSQDNPDIHSQDVKITGDRTPDDGACDSAKTEGHHFNRRSVFSSQSKWS